NTTADALSRYPVDRPDINDEDTPRLITSSTQTEDLFVNAVATRSMIRNHPPAVPSTTTSSSSPSSKPTTLPVTTSSSSFH
ncbi:unnamed protein product, partial [Rotaria magnacalcarata]